MGAKKNFIASAAKNKGALHRNLGIPQSQKIPEALLQKAKKRGGLVAKEAQLALTLRQFNRPRRAEGHVSPKQMAYRGRGKRAAS